MSDYHETEAERLEHEHDMRLAREDRRQDHAPLPDKEPNGSGDAAAVTVVSTQHVTVGVLPRDLGEWPDALARVSALADEYASVEVDRLPPLGAVHWKVTAHRADGGVDVFRVGSHGSLMPWGAR